MQKYKAYIAIDDTDEIGYFTSTGEICEEIREHITLYYAKPAPISRHQLLLHEDIPYTSHNSSMCFSVSLSEVEFKELKHFIIEYVLSKSAPSSAPGICMGFEKDFVNTSALIKYGQDAKQKVLTKEDAFAMAKMQNIFLLELKNSGQGIIGALAGVGLRVSGNDGRMRGKITLNTKSISVKELLQLGYFDEVRSKNGHDINEDILIIVNEYLKGIYTEHKTVLFVEEYGGYYKPLIKEHLLDY